MAQHRVIDYMVVTGSSEDRMVIRVKERLDEGWQPIGGLAITDIIPDNRWGPTWAQAMVKYQE